MSEFVPVYIILCLPWSILDSQLPLFSNSLGGVYWTLIRSTPTVYGLLKMNCYLFVLILYSVLMIWKECVYITICQDRIKSKKIFDIVYRSKININLIQFLWNVGQVCRAWGWFWAELVIFLLILFVLFINPSL